jgi:hypothetical protein
MNNDIKIDYIEKAKDWILINGIVDDDDFFYYFLKTSYISDGQFKTMVSREIFNEYTCYNGANFYALNQRGDVWTCDPKADDRDYPSMFPVDGDEKKEVLDVVKPYFPSKTPIEIKLEQIENDVRRINSQLSSIDNKFDMILNALKSMANGE